MLQYLLIVSVTGGGGWPMLPKLSSFFLVRGQRQQVTAMAFFGGNGCGDCLGAAYSWTTANKLEFEVLSDLNLF